MQDKDKSTYGRLPDPPVTMVFPSPVSQSSLLFSKVGSHLFSLSVSPSFSQPDSQSPSNSVSQLVTGPVLVWLKHYPWGLSTVFPKR